VEVEERGKRALVIPHSPWLAPPALMVWANVVRVTFAFVYGVLLGICWECASMIVLLAATLLEHIAGTIFMMAVFVGLAGYAFSVAARADLARPLLSIFAFRLSAQVAMTIGTGSLLLTTMLSDTPACSSDGLRTSGWRGMVVALTKWLLPRRWLRRIVGVEPPYGPPFLRVLAAVASREWLGWVPNPFGLPSLLALPGSITFKPDRATTSALEAAVAEPRPIRLEQSVLESLIPVGYGSEELAGVYTYACKDQRWSDYYYIFRYPAFWYAPASMALLHSLLSLCVKMLLMHAYASIFMLLSQSNCREAFVAELERRVDRLRRWWRPRPPVRLIPVVPGDICAICHDELLRPPPGEGDDDTEDPRQVVQQVQQQQQREREEAAERSRQQAAAAADRCSACGLLGDASSSSSAAGGLLGEPPVHASSGLSGAASAPAMPAPDPKELARFLIYCRWGCGKAVHKQCAAGWGRNACVFCAAPMS